MKIDSIQVGPIMTNCYLLCDDAAGVCCVIDPGDEPRAWSRWCSARARARYILLTHGHFDHCTGVAPGCSSGTRSCRSISVKRT